MSRCTGHCCRAFPLPVVVPFASPLDAVACDPDRFQDGRAILDMVIPLGKREDGRDIHTCRHLDAATGDCTNYDNRPRMCSEYPYGKPCEVEGCTYVAPEPLKPGIYPILVEAHVLINGVVVFGGERWRCIAYRDMVAKAQPDAKIEWILLDSPIPTTVGTNKHPRLPWPPRMEAWHP